VQPANRVGWLWVGRLDRCQDRRTAIKERL